MSSTSNFIHIGEIQINRAPAVISTLVGSCVAVCIYDNVLEIGGMNHYLLPFWNDQEVQSPKYGNISIPKLIKEMRHLGCNIKNMEAKIFGGASINTTQSCNMLIGEKNILVAKEILHENNISIVAEDIGGENGRKIQFQLKGGKVLLQYVLSSQYAI